MLFNSVEFAVFLPVVFLVYWFIVNRNLTLQNIFLLVASYFFYAWWDWRFLFLLFSISVFNYYTGIQIDKNGSDIIRKRWFIAGLIINIGILGIFKYFNFFINSFIDLAAVFGYDLSGSTIKIILPLGISFYTFLSISYIIEIYKKNLKADRNIIHVLLTLGFFPIILAGPIQRPISLLPQISSRREFNYKQAVDGLRQILWGLFVKVVVADNLAFEVDNIFKNVTDLAGSTLFLGIVLYSVQIYADFSGYSNIAIGAAKLFGISLMRNFAYPYFARDITEFWKRWHISLTTWFRDYIFLPLSFNISWKIKTEKVLLIKSDHFIYITAGIVVWFLTGLWHGANYTFIIWGLIHALFLILYHLQRKSRAKLLKYFAIKNDNFLIAFPERLITLFIIVVAWTFFRSADVNDALIYLDKMFSVSFFSLPRSLPVKVLLIALAFIMAEWINRSKDHTLEIQYVKYRPVRWSIYVSLVLLILFIGGGNQKFIYFQF